MNKDVKRKWTEALRSGQFEQGTGVLEDWEGKNCCLGVLCVLAEREGIVRREIRRVPGNRWEDEILYSGERYELPLQVTEWAGLDSSTVHLPDHKAATVQTYLRENIARSGPDAATLVNLNDNGATFAEIALVIEEQL